MSEQHVKDINYLLNYYNKVKLTKFAFVKYDNPHNQGYHFNPKFSLFYKKKRPFFFSVFDKNLLLDVLNHLIKPEKNTNAKLRIK